MLDFLENEYFGNPLKDWAIALALILASIVVGKAVYWVFKNVFRRITAKTKTKFDDIVLDMIEEPLVVIVTVIGFWYALGRLELGEGFPRFLGHAKDAAVTLAVAWLVARLVDSLIREFLVPMAERSETDLDDQLLPIVRKGAKIVIWVLGVIVALDNAGQDVGALLAGLGIGGLALAMAAKDTVSNIFGGFTIFTDRPFVLNDRVRVGDYDGMIRDIGLRSTRLETLAGTVVSIPNSTFADSPVENVSAEPTRKVTLNLGLTYDTPPERMQAALDYLREIAAANENLDEKVIVGFTAFGDFALGILMIYYIKKGADIVGTQSEVNLAILTKFNDEGLEFAFPTQTIYAHGVGASAPDPGEGETGDGPSGENPY